VGGNVPNWCSNELTVYGPKEKVLLFIERAKGQDDPLDLMALLPVPDNLLSLDGSNEPVLKWMKEKWGCWKGAFDPTTAGAKDLGLYASVRYRFRTPWSPPVALFEQEARKEPELTFVLQYKVFLSDWIGRRAWKQGETVLEEDRDMIEGLDYECQVNNQGREANPVAR
jgi:hypothetical protein